MSLRDFFTSVLNFMGIIPFSINGWGVREWSAAKISVDSIESNILIISSVIFELLFNLKPNDFYLYDDQ